MCCLLILAVWTFTRHHSRLYLPDLSNLMSLGWAGIKHRVMWGPSVKLPASLPIVLTGITSEDRQVTKKKEFNIALLPKNIENGQISCLSHLEDTLIFHCFVSWKPQVFLLFYMKPFFLLFPAVWHLCPCSISTLQLPINTKEEEHDFHKRFNPVTTKIMQKPIEVSYLLW